MERMVEEVPDLAYHQYHNFISESKWDWKEVNRQTALDASSIMQECKLKSGRPVGLLIDESAHLKKGKKSVGVARQYAGVSGKVDNCQVAVYASLCNEDNVCIIDTRLFLPEQWTSDAARCKSAGIPASDQVFETKPQKALGIIKSQVALGVKFDWIGGDGLYGHNSDLTRELDKMNLFYVLDVHKDETVYLEEPAFFVPEKKRKKGRMPQQLKTETPSIRLDDYCKNIADEDWKRVRIRKTAKGWKYVYVHTAAIWHWDGREKKTRVGGRSSLQKRRSRTRK